MELPKAYNPKDYEDKIYADWEKCGFFNPDTCVKEGVTKQDAPAFSIVLPPPNVTGTLHMGHAAMLALQDLLMRYHRLKGDKTLWLPGTDHAAIATQTKVEKILMKEGMEDPRKELGREKFLARVEKFAQESHDTIVNQCKKMGSSLDWSREAYTLDEARNLAVRTVFKQMYDDGLIYRGYRIVNWCPRCQSTLADDEVEYKEQKAKLYTFKYSADFPIAISTTRPETKLGDTAVAVNPQDRRYKKYIGQIFEVKKFAGGPDLRIKVIGEASVDMAFGTGAVGVTPAHSLVDYDMAKKNDLPVIKVINERGQMTLEAGASYVRMEVKAAREKVVKFLRENNLLEKEEEALNNLSICYRCGTTIEPLPSRQWFIDVNKKFVLKHSGLKKIKSGQKVSLKELMIAVVKNKEIEIIPDHFGKTYFHWIDNLRDWCISRQIWFGHRIPVWYKGEEIFVGTEAPKEKGWEQDPDTLDTWFSSGLWTFSTLGWPEKTVDLKTFHPTSVMETGYDILFFWVARMILMTTYALGEIPFKTVYLHGLVRDEQGRKMSKSLGNVIDPLDMIAKYGADATRLSLVLGNTPGNDMKLSEEKIEGFRNFTNKLWNISRFMLLNIEKPQTDVKEPKAKTLADKWILGRLNITIKEVTANIEKFNFSLAGETLRDFTWGDLADWYLEIAKIEGGKSETLNYLLVTILKLWHPFMPFVTEAIWQEALGAEKQLLVSGWPTAVIPSRAEESLKDFEAVRQIVTAVRSVRAEKKIEPKNILDIVIKTKEKNVLENIKVIESLARVKCVGEGTKKKDYILAHTGGGVQVWLDLSGAVDVGKEKTRLQNELAETEKYIKGLQTKLGNKDFVARAPAAIVDGEKKKLAEAEARQQKISNQLVNLK